MLWPNSDMEQSLVCVSGPCDSTSPGVLSGIQSLFKKRPATFSSYQPLCHNSTALGYNSPIVDANIIDQTGEEGTGFHRLARSKIEAIR